MSGYDAWLTTDRLADQQEAYAEHVYDEWVEYAEIQRLPIAISEDDHPDHAVYVAWEALFLAVEAYCERQQAEQEWAYAEYAADQEKHLAQIRDEEQMVLDSQAERGLKVLHCAMCGVPMKVAPSVERAWCHEHALPVEDWD